MHTLKIQCYGGHSNGIKWLSLKRWRGWINTDTPIPKRGNFWSHDITWQYHIGCILHTRNTCVNYDEISRKRKHSHTWTVVVSRAHARITNDCRTCAVLTPRVLSKLTMWPLKNYLLPVYCYFRVIFMWKPDEFSSLLFWLATKWCRLIWIIHQRHF